MTKETDQAAKQTIITKMTASAETIRVRGLVFLAGSCPFYVDTDAVPVRTGDVDDILIDFIDHVR